MNKKVIAILVVVIIVAGGAALLLGNKKNTNTNTNSSSNQAMNASMNGLTSDSMTPSFTISANDNNADHEMITVKKGAKVSLTFAVQTNNVYHGGLQFKSTDPVLDSGPIAPGSSKTVTFTADKSFSFQPYWYASGVKKDYQIMVSVE